MSRLEGYNRLGKGGLQGGERASALGLSTQAFRLGHDADEQAGGPQRFCGRGGGGARALGGEGGGCRTSGMPKVNMLGGHSVC
jgi:hypothetical protein